MHDEPEHVAPLDWKGSADYLCSIWGRNVKKTQTDEQTDVCSCFSNSLTKKKKKERNLRRHRGKVQREVNIYHNDPDGKTRVQLQLQSHTTMPQSESLFVLLSLYLPVWQKKSALTEKKKWIWDFNRFMADAQSWFNSAA